MARMVPEEPLPTDSDAERKLFGRIADELSDDWVGLHSVELADHDVKRRAEIDFVLVGAPGILCLEVKGGAVSRKHGEWWYGSHRNREGPFSQATSAMFALQSHLNQVDRDTTNVAFGCAVVLPDCDLAVHGRGPDIDTDMLVDARTIDRPLGDSLSACLQHWRGKQAARRYFDELQPGLVDRIADLLRGDFRAEVTAQSHVLHVADKRLELTDGQRRVMGLLARNPRVLVEGPAGTGKTVLALDEARRLAADGHAVLLLCFNKRLAEWLNGQLEDQPNADVHTIHGLATELGGQGFGDDRWQQMIDSAVDILLSGNDDPQYTAVVVDEGQDLLRASHLDLIDLLLAGGLADGIWRWFWDPRQDIFDVVEPDARQRLLETAPTEYPLDVNCRNTIEIAEAITDLTDLAEPLTRGVSGPEVVLHELDDHVDRNVTRVVRQLLAEGLDPSQVRVLMTRKGWRLISPGDVGHGARLYRTTSRKPLPEDGRSVELCGTGAFKGLESEAVVLVAPGDTEADLRFRREVYVGASRAGTILHVFT